MILRRVTSVSLQTQRRNQWGLPRSDSKVIYFSSNLHTTVKLMAIRSFEAKEHAQLYAKYRPTYPCGMYEEIFKYCTSLAELRDKSRLDLAVDVGCGSGQSTRPLCDYFRHVIGNDVSEEQINSASAQTADTDINKNVDFRAGPGEDLSFLKDRSVDLITTAQALPWLNLDLFYKEVRRVLKPNGVFAAYGYGINTLDDEDADKLINEFYWDLLGDYYYDCRHHVINHLRDLKFPFEPTTRIETENISIRRQWPLSAYIGYLSTSSAWQLHHKLHPDTDELKELHTKLHDIFSKNSGAEEPVLEIYWPGFLILSRKPVDCDDK